MNITRHFKIIPNTIDLPTGPIDLTKTDNILATTIYEKTIHLMQIKTCVFQFFDLDDKNRWHDGQEIRTWEDLRTTPEITELHWNEKEELY